MQREFIMKVPQGYLYFLSNTKFLVGDLKDAGAAILLSRLNSFPLIFFLFLLIIQSPKGAARQTEKTDLARIYFQASRTDGTWNARKRFL